MLLQIKSVRCKGIDMENVAIDLLWLRPRKVGGTESYIRNLLDGFLKLKEEFSFTLLVSRDNAETFRCYEKDSRYRLLVANVKSSGIAGRILWQNMFQNRFLRKHGFRKCFEPVYCKPWFNGGIEYTCVIHDLQAYHYPQYHPVHEVAYSRLCWRMDTLNAARVLTISEWVRKDIEEKYHRKDIRVIYNPVLINREQREDFSVLQEKYDIEEKQFFYAVAQIIPHKNIGTLIRIMERIVNEGSDLPDKLLISGVNGNATKELINEIREKHLQEHVLITGFVSNEERNSLYQHCHTFLYPSVFEGFGMPPVEAMLFGTKVVTTRCTSIPEVTQGKAIYVDDPYSEEEWLRKIRLDDNHSREVDFSVFLPERISSQYLKILKESEWKKDRHVGGAKG